MTGISCLLSKFSQYSCARECSYMYMIVRMTARLAWHLARLGQTRPDQTRPVLDVLARFVYILYFTMIYSLIHFSSELMFSAISKITMISTIIHKSTSKTAMSGQGSERIELLRRSTTPTQSACSPPASSSDLAARHHCEFSWPIVQ